MDKKGPSIYVSVIMPVYNGERYIGEAIESLLNQSFADWELIVVDDGSTDETANIVKRMTDSRIRYVYQENHGQASALNHGLSIAQGVYVTTLDADDWFPSNSLEDRVNYFLQHPEYDVVYGDGYFCDVAGNILMRFSELMPTGVVGDVYDVLIVSPFYGTGGSVMINRQVIEKSGIRYDEALIMCQDWDFIIRVAEKVTFGYVGKITINYRLHRGGKTLAMPRGLRLESLIRLRNKVINSSRFQEVSEAQRSAFFFDLLIKDLSGRVDDQTRIFEGAQFQALPNSQQARLLRLTALDYLIKDVFIAASKKWFWMAWALTPFDLKTGIVAVISMINPAITRAIVKAWRNLHPSTQLTSPFELAVAKEQQ